MLKKKMKVNNKRSEVSIKKKDKKNSVSSVKENEAQINKTKLQKRSIKSLKENLDKSDMDNCKIYENKKQENKNLKKLKKKKESYNIHTEESQETSENDKVINKSELFANRNTELESIHEQRKVKSEESSKEQSLKKKKKSKIYSTEDEYRPGMLSELLQKKKFGQLIIPWDPSFGLDPNYKNVVRSKEDNEEKPKLKINPLFDLSKRENRSPVTGNGPVNVETVFVGNLPTDITIQTVKKIFRKCGVILKVKLRKTETQKEGNQQVCASVKLSTSDNCQAALKLNGKEFQGHHLRVTLANQEIQSESARSVFVGNVAFNAKDDDLWKAFEDCGGIESVRIIRDSRNGKGQGYGYVNFKSTDSVDHALKLHGSSLLGRDIRVSRNSVNSRSLSNLNKVKRRNKKKKLDLSNKAGIRKPKIQSEDDRNHEHENSLKAERSSAHFQHSETDQPVVKKVKKKKKIAENQMTG